jgi:hypothetical protein
MQRYYYGEPIAVFLGKSPDTLLGALVAASQFSLEMTQRNAWLEQVELLQTTLQSFAHSGHVYFEYSIPRLGKRIDVVVLVEGVVFVLEFKVNENEFNASAVDQVCDYALDLKNFHESSHNLPIAPILVATGAAADSPPFKVETYHDGVFVPIRTNRNGLITVLKSILAKVQGNSITALEWESGRYCPTPTIIEAATSLYQGHTVNEISRNDASAINLSQTSRSIDEIIESCKKQSRKAICLVTGVPGAGKTLVGLNVATNHFDKTNELYSVFLSGNDPLVAVLREALARDKVRRERESGRKAKKSTTLSEVKAFIQNVHHFRDECLIDAEQPPIEHVALFDEAQRAWTVEQTAAFMLRKKRVSNFNKSEPEFLVSCLDRHPDWAVVVCLVGGGQEINTGEAGIGEWIDAILRGFPDWYVYISSRLTDSEYAAGNALERLGSRPKVEFRDELHLAVSMRSFRAENVSLLVKQLLDLEAAQARKTLQEIGHLYPIVLTRNLQIAKSWLRSKARGSERYGIVVSSEAQRLKPHAIDVRTPIDPIHWFLDGKDDVRSSFYLEDVATEFQVQGLELDWTCVTWDADFRFRDKNWHHWSFVGNHWNRIRKQERQAYLKNAYRVLLTRARQGMVIVVPEGDPNDPTRDPEFYDGTFEYLADVGFTVV